MLFVSLVAAAGLIGGGDLLRLGDDVARQVHSTVDWSDPEAVALARYERALAITLAPLAQLYDAADTHATPPGVLAAARASLAEAAQALDEAKDPKSLAHVAPMFRDYLHKTGRMLDGWDAGRTRPDHMDETFEAQNLLHDTLNDAQEARFLRELRGFEEEDGYKYFHRLIHYQGFRLFRTVTMTMAPAGELRRATADYRVAAARLRRFVAARSRVHDEFVSFIEAAANLTAALTPFEKALGNIPDDQWIPVPDPEMIIEAYGAIRDLRHHLLRLERTGEF